MEDNSSNYSSESEDAEDVVFSYLKTRCYIREKQEDSKTFEHTLPNVSIDSREAEVLATSRMDASDPCFITYSSCSSDINLAEQQINAFKTWLTEMEDEVCQKEVYHMIMPLLCNLYLDCLRTNLRPFCVKFLKRHAREPVLTKSWRPIFEQLLNLQSISDIEKQPLVKIFRSCKSEIRLSTRTLVALRKFLIRRKCTLLLQILKSRFKIDTACGGNFVSEEEAIYSPSVLRYSMCDIKPDEQKKLEKQKQIRKKKRKKETGERHLENGIEKCEEFGEEDTSESSSQYGSDVELKELASEIMRMRLRPTPPPPLLLYTAYKTDGVVCGEVCSRGNLAATGDHRSELRVWCLSETKYNPQLHPSYFSSVPIQAFTEPIHDVQAQNSKQWWSLRGHCDTVYDVAFSPDSDYLVSVSFDTTMRLWNLQDYSCSAVYRGHTRPVWGVSMSPAHNMVATSSSDRTARIWSLDRTFPVRVLAGHTLDVMCCSFHPNGVYVATGSVDRSLRLWSVTDGSMVRVMGRQPQQDFIECLTFSPNGQFLASAGGDSWVWVWDLSMGNLLYRLECSAGRISSLAWSADGSSITAASHDGSVFLWHLDTPTNGVYEPRKYSTKCSTVLSVQYSTKNALIAVGLH